MVEVGGLLDDAHICLDRGSFEDKCGLDEESAARGLEVAGGLHVALKTAA